MLYGAGGRKTGWGLLLVVVTAVFPNAARILARKKKSTMELSECPYSQVPSPDRLIEKG